MNIVIIIARVLFGLFGALQVFIGGWTILRGLNILPGPPGGATTPVLIFGAVVTVIGALLVFANLRNVRLALFVNGAVAILMGGVWFLQGIGKFPGQSFMNNDITWSVIGGIFALVGAFLVYTGIRRTA